MIHLTDVSKTYKTANGPVHALANVVLDVAKGEFVAVRGPSGCGKSTLLMIVGALGSPTSGTVTVGGENLLAMSAAARARFRARQVGFVFQMFHLLPYLTVLENVAAAALPGEVAAARARAAELLGQFHLGDRASHRPAELSAGERQRVAIARAMVNRPELILADEPTGNLDSESAKDVLDLLAEFHRREGTVLLVTHDEQAATYAERTLRMRGGSVVVG
jgi:ABC-type lipoprotein export system ATPase subunit